MRELVLQRKDGSIEAHVLENRSLVEYYITQTASSYALGDIFLGEVTQVIRGLNAAFVHLGLPKEGFLHYTDMGPEVLLQKAFLEALRAGQPTPSLAFDPLVSSLPKEGSIADYLAPGDWLFVQVVKEMSENKGPRLTTNIGLTGHYLVLLPFSADTGVSHRITDPTLRQFWKEQLRQLYRQSYGLILRTSGATASPAEVAAEYHTLIHRWESFLSTLSGKKPPYRLSTEEDGLYYLLNDLLNLSPQIIHTTDEALYRQIQRYFTQHAFSSIPLLRLHRRSESLRSLFDLEQAKRTLLGRTVTLPNGAYLVIEHTEALHVIDVNTGSLPAKSASVEELIFQTNLLAASEVARQLRLRDLGGIIIVDFIDMKKPEHRQRVQERLREAMRSDRAKHTILPMSEIGLVQITRQRRRQPLEILEVSPCPICHGTGRLSYLPDLSKRLRQTFGWWAERYPRLPLRIRVHPIWWSYWKDHYPAQGTWIWNLLPHRWVGIQIDESFPITTAELKTLTGEVLAVIE